MGGLATAAAIKIGASAVTGAKIGAGVNTALQIGGTALSVAGALKAGSATDEQSKAEQAFAELQATQEQLHGIEEERLRTKKGERDEARQRALFAKSGVRVNKGTPLLVMAETALDTVEDVGAIREGTKAKSSTFSERGRTFRRIGKSAKTASRFRAGSSLVSGLNDLLT